MEAAKLTLRLNAQIIEEGKAFAKRKGTSLSKMIEEFLRDKLNHDYEPVVILEPSEEVLSLSVSADREMLTKTDEELREEYLSRF
ncbi:MAG: DUF6364 family protein [Lewinella sp.]